MAKGVVSVRAEPDEIVAFKAAAATAGVSVSTWAHDILAAYVEESRRLDEERTAERERRDQIIEGQIDVDEMIGLVERERPTPSPPAAPALDMSPPPGLAQPSLNPRCQAAHLHFRLGRGEQCAFCGGVA